MDLTAAQFGGYEVWGPIGQGGMSRVWLARHRELSIPVVIKTLVETGLDAFAQLRNEARLMARIPSPRVVRAVDVGVHEATPFLVQEYVDGLDLAELDRRRRSALGRGFPLWFVCRAVHEIGGALESAHQTGILHRDVKPSNLFGSPQTGIRLGDFGIATARGNDAGPSGCTLRFAAPEALRGETPNKRWDVYSLGATAYDLYYGTPPHPDLEAILSGAPAPFPPARSADEAYFQHVLAGMLERDPDKRYPSIKLPRRLLAPLSRGLRPRLPGLWLGRGRYQLGPLHVSCRIGDIAEADTDGIVNSAQDDLRMRSGVGASLKQRGGQAIEDEAMAGGRRALGECFATGAGSLQSKKVLHAVSAWKEASCIARATQRVFLLADELGLRTLAFPALGTGSARVSPESCAYAAAAALYWHVLLGGSRLRAVEFVLYDKPTLELFIEELSGVLLGDVDPADVAASLDESQAVSRDTAFDETLQLGPIQSTQRSAV